MEDLILAGSDKRQGPAGNKRQTRGAATATSKGGKEKTKETDNERSLLVRCRNREAVHKIKRSLVSGICGFYISAFSLCRH
jgi:hypothetical protein